MASGLKMNQDDRSRESRESRSCVERFPDVSRIPGSTLPKATSVKQQIRDTTKLQDLYDVQVQVDSSRFNRFQHASIATGKYLTWSLLKDVESIATTLSVICCHAPAFRAFCSTALCVPDSAWIFIAAFSREHLSCAKSHRRTEKKDCRFV